jgi:hypothetical protein
MKNCLESLREVSILGSPYSVCVNALFHMASKHKIIIIIIIITRSAYEKLRELRDFSILASPI